jgi:hypothetical protein
MPDQLIYPETCPYCGLTFENNAEYVDVGWGGGPGSGVQVTGNSCTRCYAQERGAYGSRSEMDNVTGWFQPCFQAAISSGHEWMDGLLEEVFALGVRRGMRLAPDLGGPGSDSLAPALVLVDRLPAPPVPKEGQP